MITRRSLLRGLSVAVAAPAIVRAASLMPVKVWKEPEQWAYLVQGAWLPLGVYPGVVPADLWKEMNAIGDHMSRVSSIQPVLMGGNF